MKPDRLDVKVNMSNYFYPEKELESESPLQSLLEGAFLVSRLNKVLEDLDKEDQSIHDNVQRAAEGEC